MPHNREKQPCTNRHISTCNYGNNASTSSNINSNHKTNDEGPAMIQGLGFVHIPYDPGDNMGKEDVVDSGTHLAGRKILGPMFPSHHYV